ncbi:MAG: hypothetical protein OEX12_08495 [Gammaproteobacteria bacterium]|nr:hypothetical protein [Gammaproteobacteria bacterium]
MTTRLKPYVFALIITTGFICGCDNSPLSAEERERLPDSMIMNSTLCNEITPEQLLIEAVRIPMLHNQYSLEVSDMQRCGMHMQMDLIHSKSFFPASNSHAQYFTATSIGLKAAGFTVEKNYQQAENILGKYMAVYNEDEFFGIVYSSFKGTRNITGYFFGIPEFRTKDVFAFINQMEHRFYAPTITLN